MGSAKTKSMDGHIKAFFQPASEDTPGGHFRCVIPLHEGPDIAFEEVIQLCPQLPRGWYELALLPTRDRIEFTRDFWLMKLPFHPLLSPFLNDFFASLSNVGVYVTQRKFDDPYEAHLVYGLGDDRGFFRGSPPASEDSISNIKAQFAEFVLPVDYLMFLEIHDGFYKYTDTGLTTSDKLYAKYRDFQAFLEQRDTLLTSDGTPVNPARLIPFYESFGFPCYQCFWAEWYPEHEMGNIYYSGLTNTISNNLSDRSSPENMAFPTYLDWLMFYLETIKI
jgi:hypothetical protein